MAKLSKETKEKISKARKAYLKANPDKHPWRNKDKFKSVPCEKVKAFLNELNIQFVDEYQPGIEGRYFSIDIAMPDKMVAIEINGNQHYKKDGSLKPYYQERHDLLENNGWDVYEVHYSCCFDLNKWKDFFEKLSCSEIKVEFDYFNYKPKEKIKWECEDCSKEISWGSIRCRSCFKNYKKENKKPPKPIEKKKVCKNCDTKIYSRSELCMVCYREKISNLSEENRNLFCACGNRKYHRSETCSDCNEIIRRKVKNRPSKEELEKLILDYPFTKLGEMFGVSDNAVRKWCKKEGITDFPSPSYRLKKFHEKNWHS